MSPLLVSPDSRLGGGRCCRQSRAEAYKLLDGRRQGGRESPILQGIRSGAAPATSSIRAERRAPLSIDMSGRKTSSGM